MHWIVKIVHVFNNGNWICLLASLSLPLTHSFSIAQKSMNKYNSRIERVWHRHGERLNINSRRREDRSVCARVSLNAQFERIKMPKLMHLNVYTNEIYYGIEMNYTNTYKYWNKAAEELLNKHAKIDGVCARRQ